MRSRFGVLVGVLVVLVAVVGVQIAPVPGVSAQSGGGDDTCSAIVAAAVAAAADTCGDLARGEACLGSAGDERVSLDSLDALATTSNPEWGAALMALPAGLSENSDAAVTAILFGETEVARPALTAPDRPTLKVWNGGGSDVNLRNGAGITYELVGTLAPGQETVADGRNQQADWLRIQVDGGVAWAFAPLINWEGDASVLEVLLPDDVTSAVPASGEPFEAFTLTTGTTDMCGAASSGLMLYYTGEQPARVQVNQVNIEFSDAVLLLRAVPGENLEVLAVTGSATVTARGVSEEVAVGGVVQVNMGGDDGLTPTTTPVGLISYAFSDIA
ncbi:MAG: hypothetical protein JXQ72_17645 [Anaerolineae bacterium]|nr:hypothetical protein [Anaerolineae bacterium]